MLVGTKKSKMLLFLHLGGGVDHGPILCLIVCCLVAVRIEGC